MNQITLNLIAITIFTLTICSLMGPLLHIPPTVPAIAAFSILGLATLDTFGLQGQAGTLLIDWLAGTSGEHRQRIIHHEAGHFLVAYLLEIPVTGYALNAWEAFKQGHSARGGVRFDDQALILEAETGGISAQLLDRYFTVWMAGIAAEVLVYGTTEGGIEDRQKVRSVMAQIGQFQQASIKERWASLQAKTLIEAQQPAYQALVSAMEKRVPVEECCQIIEKHRQFPQS